MYCTQSLIYKDRGLKTGVKGEFFFVSCWLFSSKITFIFNKLHVLKIEITVLPLIQVKKMVNELDGRRFDKLSKVD